jgi:hemin uptake protein HemP
VPVRRITSASLFQGTHTEVQIEHQQQVYRLRVTSLGKLILTK